MGYCTRVSCQICAGCGNAFERWARRARSLRRGNPSQVIPELHKSVGVSRLQASRPVALLVILMALVALASASCRTRSADGAAPSTTTARTAEKPAAPSPVQGPPAPSANAPSSLPEAGEKPPSSSDVTLPGSISPVSATGDPARDWQLKYERDLQLRKPERLNPAMSHPKRKTAFRRPPANW